MTDLLEKLEPVAYEEIPKGFRSFSRDHLTDAVLMLRVFSDGHQRGSAGPSRQVGARRTDCIAA